MVEVELSEQSLVVVVKGFDKILAVKSSVEVPLEHVTGAEVGIAEEAWVQLQDSFRVGTAVGSVVAGSFKHHGEWMFWDIHDRTKAITIHVAHEKYAKLIVQVADPQAVVDAIRAKLPR
jgi:hypothetical protein